MVGAHRLKDAEHAGGIDVGGELRRVEADLHVRLCGEVVDLVGLHQSDEFDERHGIGHVGVV